MTVATRREFLATGLVAPFAGAYADTKQPSSVDIHRQILEAAASHERERRKQFATVKSPADLDALQKGLLQKFLDLLDGLPAASGPPPVKIIGRIEADDYTVDKLVYQSFPGYFVSALLYLPKKRDGLIPGILSSCGHSSVGKAEGTYQILHINLAKRGYAVLTYDPVGQGERSQFWDVKQNRSRFNLSCGEHAVLGNPLYLLGTSLAKYRIWDGMRGIDYLVSRPEINSKRIGCIGNSGGGTLTAYISALDPRVLVAVPSCYITTLPRRMGNRIQKDPDSDPEQDIFCFVSAGIDHAGLLALRVPRPTMLGTAIRDFFPIEGARATFDEVKHLYEVAGARERLSRTEADAKHGLSLPLREAAYAWFDRWLGERKDQPHERETKVTPRTPKEVQACTDGQVNITFHSRPLLPLALGEFRKQKKAPRGTLESLLGVDDNLADFHVVKSEAAKSDKPHVICVNGVESASWESESEFVTAIGKSGMGLTIIDPRGVGTLRPDGLEVKGHSYADPLCGVEENLAYNAFLIGKSLLGMRVADVRKAVRRIRDETKAKRVILCGRRDAAIVVCLAAAVEPAIHAVAAEEMLLSYLPLFDAKGRPINAASVLPRMLRDFGDIDAVLAAIAPRRILVAAGNGKLTRPVKNVDQIEKKLTDEPERFVRWLVA